MKPVSSLLISCTLLGVLGCSSTDEGGAQTPTEVGVVTQSASAATVWHSTWQGYSADTYWGDGWSYGYLNAFENKGTKSRQAYVSYSYSNVDPTSWECKTEQWCYTDWVTGQDICYEWEWCNYMRRTWGYGWGEIPQEDFRVGGNGADLATDLSQATNFYGESCTVDYKAGTWDCTYGAPNGTIDMSWSSNNGSSYKSNGQYEYSYGKYTFKNVGQWQSSSANVSGAFLDTEVNAAWGNYGKSLGVSVSKDIYPTPKP